jgi:cell shape-determining protein MreC
MKNEKRAQLEAQHQKKLESLREEVARLTSLLEQASGSKPGEPTFTT